MFHSQTLPLPRKHCPFVPWHNTANLALLREVELLNIPTESFFLRQSNRPWGQQMGALWGSWGPLATALPPLAVALPKSFHFPDQPQGVLCLAVFPSLMSRCCWNSAFCRHGVLRLQISRGYLEREREGSAGSVPPSLWVWGVLMAGTLLASRLPPPPLGLQPSPDSGASSLLPHPLAG